MPKIRPRSLALCIFSYNGRILVAEGYDPIKQIWVILRMHHYKHFE